LLGPITLENLNNDGKTVSPISTHRTTISYLKQFNNSKKAIEYGVGNPGPVLGQAQRCGGIK
jgi:hypothetical protein